MATEQHDVKTLNNLLETVVDSIDGFEQATKSVDTSAFKGIFEEVIHDRRGLRGDLENAIRTAGGTPDDEGTMLASAHRVLMRLRGAVSKGDIAVVEEAERGEDHIKAKLAKRPMPTSAARLLRSARPQARCATTRLRLRSPQRGR